jgi:hypothetical protein
MMTSGLPRRLAYRSHAAVRLGASASLLPQRANRSIASCDVRPFSVVVNSASNAAAGFLQNDSSSRMPVFGRPKYVYIV